MEARSRGTFTIEVDVLAPDGYRLGPPVVLKGRVSHVSGLSQVVTGGAALVLASWWYTHLRRRRAERRPACDDPAVNRELGSSRTVPCDLPDDVVRRLGIEIVPLSIRFGDEEFVDREELSTDEFWRALQGVADVAVDGRAVTGPVRAVLSHGWPSRVRDHIVAITLSGALSATFQSAELAAKSVAADGITCRVVDSRTVSLGTGTIALACAELAATLPADEASLDADRRHGHRSRRPHAGLRGPRHDGQPQEGWSGRQRQGAAGDGAVDQADHRRRGRRRRAVRPAAHAEQGAASSSSTRSPPRRGAMEHLAVLHADCDDIDEFVAQLRPFYADEIVVGQIGPVVGAHAGLGTIGVAFQETTG